MAKTIKFFNAGEQMANPNVRAPQPKRPQFNEATFFKYLKENAPPKLLDLLRSIDSRARVEMATYAIRYLRRHEEEWVHAERRQRGEKTKRALSDAIGASRKASVAYRELAAIEVQESGRLGQHGTPLWPAGRPFFADVLDNEEARLGSLLKNAKRLYNEKRFGVSGNHTWLVMLQEFTSEWTRRELGTPRGLRNEEIAHLIMAVKVTLGWREDKSETDKDLVAKALLKFRKNNASFVSHQIVPYVKQRCDVVADGPYLLGIEI